MDPYIKTITMIAVIVSILAMFTLPVLLFIEGYGFGVSLAVGVSMLLLGILIEVFVRGVDEIIKRLDKNVSPIQ